MVLRSLDVLNTPPLVESLYQGTQGDRRSQLLGFLDPSLEDDLELFKERVRFQVMFGEDRYRFLLKKAGGDVRRLHNLHDLYAPLINRRFEFAEIRTLLEGEGFGDVIRTILHTELFIRAIKGSSEPLQAWVLPPRQPPFWFERHERLVTR